MIERITEKLEGGFAWTVTCVLNTGEVKTAHTSRGEVVITGTKEGFDVVDHTNACVEYVACQDTDEWDQPTTTRRFTDAYGAMQVTAIPEALGKTAQTKQEKEV